MDVKEDVSEGNRKGSECELGDDTAKECRADRQNLVGQSSDGAGQVSSTFEADQKTNLKPSSSSSDQYMASESSKSSEVISSPTSECPKSSQAGGDEEVTSGKEDDEQDVDSDALRGRTDQPKRKKLDRSKLRKGKWTIEEEEYTSRIIHYFSLGFLTLPEGATLRSYIADKLNCDPMRVTKKYAGASCLGRRVFQLRDRPQPGVMQIQLARAELDLLEQRFKARVEEGRPGLPLPPQLDLLLAVTQPPQPSRVSSMAGLPSWIPSSDAQNAPLAARSEAGLRGALPLQSLQALAQALAPAPSSMASSGLQMHQHGSHQVPFFQNAQLNPGSGSTDGLNLDVALAQILLAQAAASAASQVHSASAQQQHFPKSHQQSVFQERKVLPSQTHPGFSTLTPAVNNAGGNPRNFLEELRRTYEQHVATQSVDNGPSTSNFIEHNTVTFTSKAGSNGAEVNSVSLVSGASNGVSVSTVTSSQRPPPLLQSSSGSTVSKTQNNVSAGPGQPASSVIKSSKASDSPTIKAAHKPALPSKKVSSSMKKVKMSGVASAPPRSNDDGAILMGFLSSLRNSFQSAVAQQQAERDREQQEDSEETNSSDDRQEQTGVPRRPATVTDSSSQQQESCSSVDESDWNSEDKKTDSSEDSDKDENQETGEEKYKEAVNYSKGPPRKRHKRSDTLSESRAE